MYQFIPSIQKKLNKNTNMCMVPMVQEGGGGTSLPFAKYDEMHVVDTIKFISHPETAGNLWELATTWVG